MKTSNYSAFDSSSGDCGYDAKLLGRLGRELAAAYRDTFEASLPPRLQSLVDRLQSASLRNAGTGRVG